MRRLLKSLYLLSVALCFALAALLVLSFWCGGTFHRVYLTQKPNDLRIRTVNVIVGRGEVRIDNQFQDMPAPPPISAIHATGASREARSIVRRQQLMQAQWHSQNQFIGAQIRLENQRFPMTELIPMDKVSASLVTPTWLGFHFDLDRGKGRPSYELRLLLPLWSLPIIPLLSALLLRRLGKRNPQACVECGYDLRASPERCPECGTLVQCSPNSTR